MNKLEQLKQMTDVVADTGDLSAIKQYKPVDATTNPSLLLKAVDLPEYRSLILSSRDWAASKGGGNQEIVSNSCDKLAVEIGTEILKIIPGRVSSEVDARLSFDEKATIEKAKQLVDLYDQNGIPPERVLIKIASTWEGIRAAEKLEKDGINCNLTLLFGFDQAIACADAGVFLISPFVGRILDWHKNNSAEAFTAENDPGVASVKKIYGYYKDHGYRTVVMGASFRNIGQIEELAGCDRLTISPTLLDELSLDLAKLERKLHPSKSSGSERIEQTESSFRLGLNADAMAHEKLGEGIRLFAKDQERLENIISEARE